MSSEIIGSFSRQFFIPIIKEKNCEQIVSKIKKLGENNFRIIEIAYFQELEVDFLRELKKSFPWIYLGIASIRKTQELNKLVNFVDFFTSAFTSEELIEFSLRQKINLIPGAYTVSEIFRIQENFGNTRPIKLFPVTDPEYFARVKSCFPKQEFILSGVNLEQIEQLSDLGAFAFLSSRLFDSYSIDKIEELRNRIY